MDLGSSEDITSEASSSDPIDHAMEPTDQAMDDSASKISGTIVEPSGPVEPPRFQVMTYTAGFTPPVGAPPVWTSPVWTHPVFHSQRSMEPNEHHGFVHPGNDDSTEVQFRNKTATPSEQGALHRFNGKGPTFTSNLDLYMNPPEDESREYGSSNNRQGFSSYDLRPRFVLDPLFSNSNVPIIIKEKMVASRFSLLTS